MFCTCTRSGSPHNVLHSSSTCILHHYLIDQFSTDKWLSFPTVSLCVCVCVCYHSSSPLKAKVRYRQKALDIGNKINIGIKLKFSVQKLWQLLAYPKIFTWHLWQETDACRSLVLLQEDYWYDNWHTELYSHYILGLYFCAHPHHKIWLHHHATLNIESWYSNKLTITETQGCKRNNLTVRTN